jgi:transcriptional regulator with XRE-family HTH domain
MSHIRSPDGTDVEVGRRIRLQRLAHSMSQTDLANQLGLTFQQVQKYEKGANRVSAGRLQRLADIFEVAPAFFFTNQGKKGGNGNGVDLPEHVTALCAERRGHELAKAFVAIGDPELRGQIVDLVRDIARATAIADKPPKRQTARGTRTRQ